MFLPLEPEDEICLLRLFSSVQAGSEVTSK